MEHELLRLEKTDRGIAADEVARTGAMGDFSENAAYQVAKAKLRGINTRITTLQEQLKRAIVIQPTDGAESISIGMTVTVQTGTVERTYQLVGSAEADPAAGRISQTSPLGAALIGHRVGDTVSYKTTKGEVSYTVTAVQS